MFVTAARNARSTGAFLAVVAVLASGGVTVFATPAASEPLPCSVSPVLGCLPDIPTLPAQIVPPP